ncbi:MAG: hypothetical protein ACD_43C00086G0001, partial [uncultured bacterium]
MAPKNSHPEHQRSVETGQDDGELSLSPNPEDAVERLESAAIGAIHHEIDTPLEA